VSQPASLTWLTSHELRLGWRDWASLMTAGGRTRARTAAIALIAFAGFMHVFAYWTVASFANENLASDTATLVGITGSLVLSWSLLLSQGMESVTRAFYSRSDLDLVLTSPASARKVFAVRMARIAAAAIAIAVLLAAPFINVLAVLGGSRWLSAYGVVAAMGAVATAAALALTVALFRIIGAKRTRLIAQIVAAVIGAAFVILLQIAAIFSAGSLSRFAALQSNWMLSHAPDTTSAFWWPARAVLGDYAALAGVMAFGIAALGVTIWLFSRRFGEHALAAAGVSSAAVRQRRWSRGFRRRSVNSGGGHGGRPARRRTGVAFDFRRGRPRSCRHRADYLATHPVGQDRSSHRSDRARLRADRCRFDPRYCIRGHCLWPRHIDRGSSRDGHPALLPRAGAAQSIPPQADLIPPRHIRGSFFLDSLGCDNRAGGRANLGGAGDGGDRPRHPGRRLADQSVADLISQANAARKRPRPTRIPIKTRLRILAPIPAAKAGA
jgi:hypothetical protein